MNAMIRKKHKLFKIINYSLISLPTPINLSSWWNFGSILGMCLIIQLLSGLILSMHYTPNVNLAFYSISHIIRDVNYGWTIRIMHSNGASMFFICLYIHTGRGIYYSSYKFSTTWLIGVMLMLMVMASAFLGYVLPWGQMSFWGATVITNLLSAIPYLGDYLVKWIWGGFSVDNSTLNRFFSIHFILPFMVTMMSMIHLFFLHTTGSSNPMGLNSNNDKIPFHPYYSGKDIMGFSMMLLVLLVLSFAEPYMLSDPDNFTPANPMVTPVHIQPEWYFLFAYAILRSVPNKLGGVLALLSSILILLTLPMTMKMKFKGMQFYPMNQILFWMFINNIIMLTWIGARPVEEPFTTVGVMLSGAYFSYFILNPAIAKLWDKIIS